MNASWGRAMTGAITWSRGPTVQLAVARSRRGEEDVESPRAALDRQKRTFSTWPRHFHGDADGACRARDGANECRGGITPARCPESDAVAATTCIACRRLEPAGGIPLAREGRRMPKGVACERRGRGLRGDRRRNGQFPTKFACQCYREERCASYWGGCKTKSSGMSGAWMAVRAG